MNTELFNAAFAAGKASSSGLELKDLVGNELTNTTFSPLEGLEIPPMHLPKLIELNPPLKEMVRQEHLSELWRVFQIISEQIKTATRKPPEALSIYQSVFEEDQI